MAKVRGLTQSKAALVAATALLVNITVAPVAYFGILPEIIDPTDVAATIDKIIASGQLFRIAICLLTLNGVADVVVFWALYSFLKPIGKNASLLMVLFGVMHVVVGLSSLNNLADLLHMSSRAASDASLNAGMFHAQAMQAMDAFYWAWQAGMVMFGIHLLLRGWLIFNMQRWLGVVLLMAATGYLMDGFGQILISGYNTTVVSNYVGWLEALLPIWLLMKGRKAAVPNSP